MRAAVFAAARVAVTERSRRVVSSVVTATRERVAGAVIFRPRAPADGDAAARAALPVRGFVSARGAAFLAFLLAMGLLVCPRGRRAPRGYHRRGSFARLSADTVQLKSGPLFSKGARCSTYPILACIEPPSPCRG